ncbi:MAG: NAD/NADP octopine/nopaline dehydrogenase family protein [Candidatus Velthaea sp.]
MLRRGVFSAHGLQSTGAVVASASKVRVISSLPSEVIPGADIIMLAVPAYAHAALLTDIGPYLKNDVLVGSLPTRSGFEFEATSILSKFRPHGARTFFGLQTLPWSTRVQEPGRIVNFGAVKAAVLMAALPGAHATSIAHWLSQLIGTHIRPTQNFLNMTLGNPGQVVHPGLMYGFFGTWSGSAYSEDTIPRFYADASDGIGAFVEHLSDEIVAVAQEVQGKSGGALDLSGVLPIHEWLRISYPTQTEDTTSVATCFRTGPLQVRKAPMCELSPRAFVPDFAYRYLGEDVPFGLVVTKAIAQLADVATPAIDAVILWAQDKLGKTYLVDGNLDGPDAQILPLPQNHGVATLAQLVSWYSAVDLAIGITAGISR